MENKRIDKPVPGEGVLLELGGEDSLNEMVRITLHQAKTIMKFTQVASEKVRVSGHIGSIPGGGTRDGSGVSFRGHAH
jgi:hypothetical protein